MAVEDYRVKMLTICVAPVTFVIEGYKDEHQPLQSEIKIQQTLGKYANQWPATSCG